MSVSEFDMFQNQQRSNWVRMRTLATLRWFAVIGQLAAIFVAIQIYNLQIEAALAAVVIGLSVIANLISNIVYPENKRLSEREATLWLVFDIVQLNLLLFVTGGMNNPFAMLIIAPVTIAATVLHLRSTIFLGLIAIISATIISTFHLPIITQEGVTLALPVLFQFGFWLALVIGVIFLGVYARQVTTEMHNMREALVATQLALAREQKLTDLGGVVAAAAHELGTPLATIKLVSSELMDELSDNADLYDDASLIREQANRCRDILQSMGRAGKDDLHLHNTPLEAVVREAAEPHMDRGKAIEFQIQTADEPVSRHPTIARRPEIIHGLRNLIQNAVDFSDTGVKVYISWSTDHISVRILDDGKGFPQSVIGRLGEPYIRPKRTPEENSRRPGYEGMGLGLFIAKTLLERSGATLSFANGRKDTDGAIVNVVWKYDDLVKTDDEWRKPLGDNTLNVPPK